MEQRGPKPDRNGGSEACYIAECEPAYLTRQEMTAILDAIKQTLWTGQRDHLLLSSPYNTGARVSELLQFRSEDPRGRHLWHGTLETLHATSGKRLGACIGCRRETATPEQ
jgi:integrase